MQPKLPIPVPHLSWRRPTWCQWRSPPSADFALVLPFCCILVLMASLAAARATAGAGSGMQAAGVLVG